MTGTFPVKLAGYLAGRVDAARRRYRKRLDRCRRKFPEAAAHELRIETRRLLALLDLLEAFGRGERSKKLRKVLKRRLDAIDDLRDTHVQLRLLKMHWPDFPEARPFKLFLCRREKRLTARLARKIKAAGCARVNRRLKAVAKRLRCCASAKSNQTSDALALAASRRVFARVAALRREVRRDSPPTIHRMRVAFKEFRYVSELLRPFLPGCTPERLERMKEYQAAAGDVQDIQVLLLRLTRLVDDGKIDQCDVRHLRKELLRRRHQAIESFMARIDELQEFRPGTPHSAVAGKIQKHHA